MHLADHGHAAIAQLLGDADLPQRALAGELARHAVLDRLVEILRGRPADMAGDVETRIVDPARRVDVQRRRADLLPVPGRTTQPQADVAAQLPETRQRPVGRRLEQRRPAGMHVGGGVLQAHERVVQRRQTGSGGHLALLVLSAFSGFAANNTPRGSGPAEARRRTRARSRLGETASQRSLGKVAGTLPRLEAEPADAWFVPAEVSAMPVRCPSSPQDVSLVTSETETLSTTENRCRFHAEGEATVTGPPELVRMPP